MSTEAAQREAAATAFADWMHVQGYTNNVAVSPAIAMLMAKAWQNGVTYGLCVALDLYDAVNPNSVNLDQDSE